ncbi:MAG TPA: ABC transporter permease [Pseudolabrys sp.]|nr:ABC transporter permease [Pseudolabrys sp.]
MSFLIRFERTAISLSSFAIGLVLWEIIARSGYFPPAFFPDLGTIAATLVGLLKSGILITAALGTLSRLLLGFVIAAVAGVILGMLMGRFQWVEDTFLPLLSIVYPIPALAYAPLFVLWFGLGNLPSVLMVILGAAFTIAINTWKGVAAVKPIWIRSAEGMGISESGLFWRVILPASLPYTLTGLRLGIGAAWRVLVGVEMLTAVDYGLGSLIFGAQKFLNTDVMLSGIIVIAIIGFGIERLVFELVERRTLLRWGMVTT